MYVYPDSDLYILKNVNLNNDYDHTIYFTNIIDQTDFFMGKYKYHLTNQSYMRKERGWMNVDINQNDLFDCTYLMFKNTHYTGRWFYAFILSVDYVNDKTSKINFEIDVMQTWHFDYVIEPSFVVREHTLTDNMYENTIDENLDLGPEYHVQANARYNLDCSLLCLVESGRWNAPTDEYVAYPPSVKGKYFTGVYFASFDLEDVASWDSLKQHISSYIAHGIDDSIIAVYQYPRFMGNMGGSGIVDTETGYAETDYTFYPNLIQIDGYIPKNKKLFTYPYNFIEIDNGVGDTAKYKLEEWDRDVGSFRIYGTPYGIPSCACMPRFYNGEANSFQNALTLKINVQGAWSGDAYQVWLARNEKNFSLSLLSNTLGMLGGAGLAVAGLATENPALTHIGGSTVVASGGWLINSIKSVIAKKNETDATPDPVHGQISNDLLNLQSNLVHFAFRQKTIRNEYAKIIDEYFSRFGYACHRVKIPNRNARQKWTYTKTLGCELTGNLPSDDLARIKSIYDNGITFWNNGNAIGLYGDFTNPVYS